MPKLIAGADDAGRGPIIGPLIIAGILIPEEKQQALRAMGARDSKLLTPRQRTDLNVKIRELALKVSIVESQPKEIDEIVLHAEKLRKLNFLEAKMMARVIEELGPDTAYVDASDVNEARFGEDIRGFLPASLKEVKICSEHHADRTYPVVSGASIVAKVRRDTIVDGLRQQYGDFGSGYISDPKTMSFLREWRRRHTGYPPIVRMSWKTIKDLEEERTQSRLGA
ncbi:MAG TPA: ribonuclease HII [Candidatus Acidoferrales bacterium]|nr:ribonuclease HII [Candidatus Acidoferrales bacterium]